MPVTYHLVPVEYWRAQPTDRPYVPEAFENDGFVHCTDGLDELVHTGNRHCHADRRPYVALVLDVEQLTSPVRYEDPGRIYPHIYGHVNRDAIVEVLEIPRDDVGTFLHIRHSGMHGSDHLDSSRNPRSP